MRYDFLRKELLIVSAKDALSESDNTTMLHIDSSLHFNILRYLLQAILPQILLNKSEYLWVGLSAGRSLADGGSRDLGSACVHLCILEQVLSLGHDWSLVDDWLLVLVGL